MGEKREMTRLERECMEFILKVQGLYFNKRDLLGVLQLMDPEICWIGTGEKEICRGREDAIRLLSAEAQGYQGTFDVLGYKYDVQELAPDLCLVQGSIALQERENDQSLNLMVRVSLLCVRKGGAILLRQIHMSTPSSDQLDGDFFPRGLSAENVESLRRLLNERASQLEERDRQLSSITDSLPGGVMSCSVTPELQLIQYSQGFLDLFGYTAQEVEELFQGRFMEMVHPEDRETSWKTAQAQLAREDRQELEYRIIRKDGRPLWVLDRGTLVHKTDGQRYLSCILLDIDRSKKAREELRLRLEQYQIIMDQATDVIFEWDIAADTLVYSSNWEKRFGYLPVSQGIQEGIPHSQHIHPDDLDVFLDIMHRMASGEAYGEAEFRIVNQAGRYLWNRIRATLLTDGQGRPYKVVGVVIDIDQEKRQTQRLLAKAERDTLTGLYNKGTTESLMEQRLTQIEKASGCTFLMVDVDNFKLVNDRFGHLSGDAILSEIASMLQGLFRQEDIVGRIGGDEFAILMTGSADPYAAQQKAQDILNAFGRLLPGGVGEGKRLSCSVGIALAPQDGETFQALYHNADLALYRAKIMGKNKMAFYSSDLYTFGGPNLDLAASPPQAAIDSDRATGAFGRPLADYVFNSLYHAIDIEVAIPRLLEIIGRRFDVSRVYIFEDSPDGLSCDNTFEWCAAGIVPQKESLQRVLYEELGDYYQNFDERGIFCCQNVARLNDQKLKRILEDQRMKSVLQCAIRDRGKNRGFIGFDECRNNRYWTQDQMETLSFLASLLSVFLLKDRAQSRMELCCAIK